MFELFHFITKLLISANSQLNCFFFACSGSLNKLKGSMMCLCLWQLGDNGFTIVLFLGYSEEVAHLFMNLLHCVLFYIVSMYLSLLHIALRCWGVYCSWQWCVHRAFTRWHSLSTTVRWQTINSSHRAEHDMDKTIMSIGDVQINVATSWLGKMSTCFI